MNDMKDHGRGHQLKTICFMKLGFCLEEFQDYEDA